MLQLPSRFATVILRFAPLFFQRSWCHADCLGGVDLGEAGQGSGRAAAGMPDEELPFLTALEPSKRYNLAHGRRH